MLKQLNLQRLEQRRKIARLKCIYSMHRNLFNFDVQQYIKPRSSRSVRSSHPDQITPIMARIDAFKYSFFPRTIEDWNSLPHEIVNMDSLNSFEDNVLAYLASSSGSWS
ncbi:unnamed protein product [Ixodes pacificus]